MEACSSWLFIPLPVFSVTALSGVFIPRTLSVSDRWMGSCRDAPLEFGAMSIKAHCCQAASSGRHGSGHGRLPQY